MEQLQLLPPFSLKRYGLGVSPKGHVEFWQKVEEKVKVWFT